MRWGDVSLRSLYSALSKKGFGVWDTARAPADRNLVVLGFDHRVERPDVVLFERGAHVLKIPSRCQSVVSRAGIPRPVLRYRDLAMLRRDVSLQATHLRHGGELRVTEDEPWMPMRGFETLIADPPGLVWWGRIRIAPDIWVDAGDSHEGGKVRMTIKSASSTNGGGIRAPELDDCGMLRLLAEMVWLPTSFFDERYVTWAEIDDASARATFRLGDRSVSARFDFGADGMPEEVAATRLRDVRGRKVETPWVGRFRDYRSVEGVRVPFEFEFVWMLDSGPSSIMRYLVDSIEFDREFVALER